VLVVATTVIMEGLVMIWANDCGDAASQLSHSVILAPVGLLSMRILSRRHNSAILPEQILPVLRRNLIVSPDAVVSTTFFLFRGPSSFYLWKPTKHRID